MNLLKKKFTINHAESIIFGFIWLLVLLIPFFIGDSFRDHGFKAIFSNWLRLLPFILFSVLNHFLLVPKLFFNKKGTYVLSVIIVIVICGLGLEISKKWKPIHSNHPEIRREQALPMHPESNHRFSKPEIPRPMVPTGQTLPPPYNTMLQLLLVILADTGFRALFRWNKMVKEKKGLEKVNIQTSLQRKDDFLFIKSEYKLLRINVNEIRYLESMRDYIRIHLVNKKPIMTLLSLKRIEEGLPKQQFMRVHRSYIVNLKHIEVVERMRIVFDDKVYIPVSEQYKEAFQEYIDKNFL